MIGRRSRATPPTAPGKFHDRLDQAAIDLRCKTPAPTVVAVEVDCTLSRVMCTAGVSLDRHDAARRSILSQASVVRAAVIRRVNSGPTRGTAADVFDLLTHHPRGDRGAPAPRQPLSVLLLRRF